MADVVEKFKIENGWEEVEDMDEFFTFEKVGDCVCGIYTNKETNVGRNKANVYTLKNGDVEHKIFGTVAINKKMEEIPLGYQVGFIYMGEKPSAPPKKPYKMFRVFKRNPNKNDEPKTFFGDEEAVKWIDGITDDLIEDGVEPTEKEILARAKKYHIDDKDALPPSMLARIEKELKRKG